MAFKYNEMSALVMRDPTTAFEQLREKFREHEGDAKALAKAVGVNRGTVFRWLNKFHLMGLGDPRDGKRGVTGRRPGGTPGGVDSGGKDRQIEGAEPRGSVGDLELSEEI